MRDGRISTLASDFEILDREFPQVDPSVVFAVLQQCLEVNAVTAVQQARATLQEIAAPQADEDPPASSGGLPASTVAHHQDDPPRLPSPLRMRVNTASTRYPLLHEDAIVQICTAYADRQAEAVLREAHQQLVSERTQVD